VKSNFGPDEGEERRVGANRIGGEEGRKRTKLLKMGLSK